MNENLKQFLDSLGVKTESREKAPNSNLKPISRSDLVDLTSLPADPRLRYKKIVERATAARSLLPDGQVLLVASLVGIEKFYVSSDPNELIQ